MKLRKCKIIAEYKNFYLTEDEKGYKESFDKVFYKPTIDGYIVIEEEDKTPMPQMARNKKHNAWFGNHKI